MIKRNPTVILNEYLQAAIPKVLPDLYGDAATTIRPARPTDISTIWNEGTTLSNDTALGIVYERMFKLRRGAFPHCKCEQVIYYLYSVGGSGSDQVETLMDVTQAIFDLVDRGDESAEEINAWQNNNLNANGKINIHSDGEVRPDRTDGAEFEPVRFSELRLFQLEEGRDIIDFATAETYFGNKLIIDYEYHDTKGFNNGEPFVKDTSTLVDNTNPSSGLEYGPGFNVVD